jgi:hypothetical protein
METEIIKFKIDHEYRPIKNIDISDFSEYKKSLLDKNLIGTLREGKFSGYDCGNMSIRLGDDNCLITGTQTSSKLPITLDDFAIILDYNTNSFLVKSYGMVKPSSEAPLHWSAYQADPSIKAVIHAHIFDYDLLYERAINFFSREGLPVTKATGGTKEVGVEVLDLIKERGYENVIGMSNHSGGFGLLSMGLDLKDAYLKLIDLQDKLLNHQS